MGTFSLSFMPGSENCVVFHDVGLQQTFRGKGVGKALLNLRVALVHEMEQYLNKAYHGVGPFSIVAVVAKDNAVERHLLEAAGFKCRHFNSRQKIYTYGG